jgi:hypothetical protein
LQVFIWADNKRGISRRRFGRQPKKGEEDTDYETEIESRKYLIIFIPWIIIRDKNVCTCQLFNAARAHSTTQ